MTKRDNETGDDVVRAPHPRSGRTPDSVAAVSSTAKSRPHSALPMALAIASLGVAVVGSACSAALAIHYWPTWSSGPLWPSVLVTAGAPMGCVLLAVLVACLSPRGSDRDTASAATSSVSPAMVLAIGACAVVVVSTWLVNGIITSAC